MSGFRVREYMIKTPKLEKKRPLRIAFLADLHGVCHGEDSACLLDAIAAGHPDLVICAGDMIVRNRVESLHTAQTLLLKLAEQFPVFLGPGNHESRMRYPKHEDFRKNNFFEMQTAYAEYEETLKNSGVHLLCNEHARFEAGDIVLDIASLELDLVYYGKPFAPFLRQKTIQDLAGIPGDGVTDADLTLLIAHNPRFARAYFKWGADLIFSGHYHGGVVRFSEHVCLVSPQFIPFPGYGCGVFHRSDQHLFVSPGLGEHTIPFRIHNPRELFIIQVTGE
ncbi:MAG: metallophosphoesterase [Blautia sp.]|nr:metallophosphoesterase [Blautia sp.]